MFEGGLILEGGGMRGVYTAGVLDFFMDQKLEFQRVYGISAGACNALTYLSGDRGRYLRVTKTFCNDPRYVSPVQLLLSGSIFNWDFSFYEIPKRYIPFDYNAMERSKMELIIGATDCRKGRCTYFSNRRGDDMVEAAIASSSIPLLSNMREINGCYYLDGGITDSIPVQKALDDGCQKVVAVLTQNQGYTKAPTGLMPLIRAKYQLYPGVIQAMENRHLVYNQAVTQLEELEQAGRAVIIRPTKPMELKRIEHNKKKLQAAYENGYEDAQNILHRLL